MRLNPDIPKYLQVLIGWLEKENSFTSKLMLVDLSLISPNNYSPKNSIYEPFLKGIICRIGDNQF